MNIQFGFYDLHKRFSKLSESGDALERLDAVIDWEMFRAELERIDRKERKSAAGRKPIDRVVMFKMLVLQNLYGLSDEALEYQVSDRLTFMRFLGIDLAGTVPDAKTVWLFRERLREAKVFDRLFEQFQRALSSQGVKLNSGQIVDASFVEAPRQRNTREENETIKDGAIPKDWTDNAAKCRQKDIDARWTKKNDEDHYGYKTHVSVDRKTKLVIEERSTAANVHDSQVFDELLGKPKKRGRDVWADSAYRSAEQERSLKRHGFRSHVHERAYRGRPLSDAQQRDNRRKSRVRVRVEHVFATMTQMGGMTVRTIGIERMRAWSTMKALSYNLKRLEVLIRLRKIPIDGIGAPA
jgi:IS5 family transposase